MLRTLILGLLLVATSGIAAADEPATSTLASTASAPAATRTGGATKHAAKKPNTSTRLDDGKPDPAAATSQADPPGGDVKMSGMSILGNEDAPKSLVIVPWKGSQLADMPNVSRLLDSATQPVDKDVFLRELAYYEFKSSSK